MRSVAGRRAAVGTFAPRSPSALALARLWTAVERRLARNDKER
jgi:hypothetical protein